MVDKLSDWDLEHQNVIEAVTFAGQSPQATEWVEALVNNEALRLVLMQWLVGDAHRNELMHERITELIHLVAPFLAAAAARIAALEKALAGAEKLNKHNVERAQNTAAQHGNDPLYRDYMPSEQAALDEAFQEYYASTLLSTKEGE